MEPISPNHGSTVTPRITQGDIARAAGVHNTTVSLALRNSPAIPETTRKRIQAIAEQLGYYPDPALRALVAYRNGRVPNRPKDTLAYVTNWDARWSWRTLPFHERAYVGAQRKAAELGYQLEHFWLGEPGMSQRRLSSMLFHRGITGALIASHRAECDQLSEIDWSRLSAVKIGSFPHAPRIHRVTEDYSGMARLALRRARSAGFERIGVVMADWWDDFSDQAWSAGFLSEQSRSSPEKPVPFLRLGGSRADWTSGRATFRSSRETSALAQWYHDHRPEVVVGFSALVLAQLEHLGLAVPRDVAFVDLSRESSSSHLAGVQQNSEAAGEVAAAIVVGQIQQNLFGLPPVATTTLVEGNWCDGASLPAGRVSLPWDYARPASIEEFEGKWSATA